MNPSTKDEIKGTVQEVKGKIKRWPQSYEQP